MDRRQRKRLKSLLAELDAGERNRFIKRAAKLRKAALRTRRPDEHRLSLEDFLLELISQEMEDGGRASGSVGGDSVGAFAVDSACGDAVGIVSGITVGACKVRPDGGGHDNEISATLSPELARRQRSDIAVGDRVRVEQRGDAHRVTAVLPRHSLLTRADPQAPGRQRAIAANIDLVVIVVAAAAPPLHIRLIDRCLVAVGKSGARPVLVVNKIDLLDEHRLRQLHVRLQAYHALGMPVLTCSVAHGDGIGKVREALTGRTCVFVGQSGVGKSSLLNVIGGHEAAAIGKEAAATGDVRAGDGRGRHTTVASALYDLPDGIRVIDTPGIRRFSVDGADTATIAAGFVEFTPYVARCRFRDCTHVHEPGCAVRRAVADGAVPRSRYVSYRKLLGGDDDSRRAADNDPMPARPPKARPPKSSCGPPSEPRSSATGSRAGVAAFTCANCGRPVPIKATGIGHRNHCPHCLHSVHLDDVPGDRAACCGAVMDPVTVWVRRAGEWALVHRCRACGRLSSNRIAGDDNETLLLSLAVRPLSAPPFPLDGLAGLTTGDRGTDT